MGRVQKGWEEFGEINITTEDVVSINLRVHDENPHVWCVNCGVNGVRVAAYHEGVSSTEYPFGTLGQRNHLGKLTSHTNDEYYAVGALAHLAENPGSEVIFLGMHMYVYILHHL